MLRLARETHPPDLAGLQACLEARRHLPADMVELFATPRRGQDGAWEWWTHRQGRVLAAGAITQDQSPAFDAALSRALTNLQRLATDAGDRGQTARQTALLGLAQAAEHATLYSVGGAPVFACWRMPDAASVPPPLAAAPPEPVAPPARRRVSWALLGALLLATALLLAYCARRDTAPPTAPVVVAPTASAVIPKSTCVNTSAQELPPEFVVVFDTSASMVLNVGATSADEQWMFSLETWDGTHLPLSWRRRIAALLASPTRQEVAADGLATLFGQLAPTIDVGLVTFQGCTVAPPSHGFFPASGRQDLAHRLHTLQPDGGTPIAASLAAAVAMIDGKTRDAVIVMFVDGADGCKGEPCKTAATLAAERPRLTVNVVDISGTGQSNCIAEQTGGRVFTPASADQVAHMITQAAAEVLTCSLPEG